MDRPLRRQWYDAVVYAKLLLIELLVREAPHFGGVEISCKYEAVCKRSWIRQSEVRNRCCNYLDAESDSGAQPPTRRVAVMSWDPRLSAGEKNPARARDNLWRGRQGAAFAAAEREPRATRWPRARAGAVFPGTAWSARAGDFCISRTVRQHSSGGCSKAKASKLAASIDMKSYGWSFRKTKVSRTPQNASAREIAPICVRLFAIVI